MSEPIRDKKHLFVEGIIVGRAFLNDFCDSQGCPETDIQKRLEWLLNRLHPEFEKIGPHDEQEMPSPDGAFTDNVGYRIPVGRYFTEEEFAEWNRSNRAGAATPDRGRKVDSGT